MSTRKHGLNLLVGFSSSKQGQLFFLFFVSPVAAAMSVSQSALLSSASEVKVGWRAAAAAGSWAGNNPPVIEIYILKHFLNSWLHNRFLHFQV